MKCPHRNELIQLNGDDLPSDRSESLFDHLEACEPCATAFEQLAESTNNLGEHLAGIHQKDIQKAREKIAKRPGIQEPVASPKTDSGESQYALSPGQKLEKYEIIRLLDTGGMGEVYEARHGLMRHRVAIKVIRGRHQDNPVAYQKFLTEMKTLARVKHPNLVRALDGGHEDGCLFVVMELLGGESLHTLCVERRIRSVIEIIDAMLGLCRGLGKLHAHQLLHRDVKPANIMRLKDGTIKVIDLGLAADNVAGRQMSHVGAGTQGYMPPEQTYGSDSLNERSDIFSAGRVLKDLLRSLRDARANSNQTNAVSRLEKLAEWMTKLEMENRPQSVKEVLVELKKLRRAMGNSRKRLATATQAAKPQAQPKRRGIGWSVIAVLLIGIIGVGAWQIIFKTDRRATVLVENHQPGDVIQITSEDGKVRSVELGDQPKFIVDRGTYELSLEGPDNRRLNPANITVTGLDQLSLRIEDRPGGFADEAPWIDLLAGSLENQWRGSIGTPKQQAGMSTSSRRVAQKQADSMVRQHWRLSGGVLSYDGHPKGPNLSTTREFRNFELSLEWKIAKGGDSGIYLRGLPQVQIWDPNSDKELALQGSGGLYNNQTHSNVPTVRADRPVGQWNEMSIWLIDDKASVELNGRQVVDSIVMENFDDRSQPLYPEGSIELQKHFGPLSFRNIRVRNLVSRER